MLKLSPPPGTSDILPEQISAWHRLEDTARKIFPLYGYGEIRTPVFEYTEVFKRGIGNETEIVQKEMYSFKDKGGRSLTLRPEGTAGIMRSLTATDVMNGNERRVYSLGPMFRGERPAAGRRRQFHQIGVENVGRIAPELDAECIAMLMHYLEELDIAGSRLLINTRGTLEDRKPAEKVLHANFIKHISSMCEDCKNRLKRNVWRILDCKQPECRKVIKNSPPLISYFGEKSRSFFEKVCEILSKLGINYEIEPKLVRGLDYYVHTVFEVVHPALGAQDAIAGGGRYEISLPGNKNPIIGVGFAAGLERLLMAQECLNVTPPPPTTPWVFLAGLGIEAINANMMLAMSLRRKEISTVAEIEEKSIKAQLRAANRLGVKFTIIRGETELKNGVATCKNMKTGEQKEIPFDKLEDFLKNSFPPLTSRLDS